MEAKATKETVQTAQLEEGHYRATTTENGTKPQWAYDAVIAYNIAEQERKETAKAATAAQLVALARIFSADLEEVTGVPVDIKPGTERLTLDGFVFVQDEGRLALAKPCVQCGVDVLHSLQGGRYNGDGLMDKEHFGGLLINWQPTCYKCLQKKSEALSIVFPEPTPDETLAQALVEFLAYHGYRQGERE